MKIHFTFLVVYFAKDS